MTDAAVREMLEFAVEIAREAGDLTLRYFNADTPYEMKRDNTPVTVADRGAEELLRARILERYPTHAVLGEEYGETPGSEPVRWVLDPIDGTFSFISGVPLYSVLVGIELAGEAVAGVIHLPALRETVSAGRGLGCHWDGREGRVSTVSDLAQARLLVCGTKNLYRHGRGPAFEALRERCYADRSWSDAYAYALVATGRAEIVLDPVMSLWDTTALAPIVREAGGTLTDWAGVHTHAAPEAVATNGRLFEQVVAILRNGRLETGPT